MDHEIGSKDTVDGLPGTYAHVNMAWHYAALRCPYALLVGSLIILPWHSAAPHPESHQ